VSLGPIVETFVFAELSKQATWSDERISIHHYRDHNGAEIDFILENWGRKVVAIEVKSGSTVRPEAFAPMRKLSSALRDKFALGVVLYDGRHRLQYADRLWAIPIASLWA
jgi:predicted AAA+ superfamily ATPase